MNYTCVNDVYQDFVTNVLSVIDFIVPVRTLSIKSNTKPWLDIDVLNAIRNRDKHCRKFKRSGKETDKGNFMCAKLLLKKVINNKKNFTLKKRLQKKE